MKNSIIKVTLLIAVLFCGAAYSLSSYRERAAGDPPRKPGLTDSFIVPTPTPVAQTPLNEPYAAIQDLIKTGDGQLAAGKPDAALQTYQTTLTKIPATKNDDALDIMTVSTNTALVKRKMAGAYLAKNDAIAGARSCAEGIKGMADNLPGATDLQIQPISPLFIHPGLIVRSGKLFALYSASRSGLDTASECVKLFKDIKTPAGIETYNTAINDAMSSFSAALVHVVAKSAEAEVELTELCSKDPCTNYGINIANFKADAYQKLNAAISYAPRVKELYQLRARLYRVDGNVTAAQYDEWAALALK